MCKAIQFWLVQHRWCRCRWSVIRTDQTPRFGTHVIRGLTVKFNHHRVKVYNLHVFCLANLPIQTILNHSYKRERALFFFYRCRTHPKRPHAERERGAIHTDWFLFHFSLNGHIHTKLCLNTHFGKYSGKHSWLCLKWTETAEKETGCVSVLGTCIRS